MIANRPLREERRPSPWSAEKLGLCLLSKFIVKTQVFIKGLEPSQWHRTHVKGSQWNIQGRRVRRRVCRWVESITFSDRPWGADFFLGNSLPRARKSARDLKVGGVLSGVLVQGESWAGCTRGHCSERRHWAPVESQGTGKHKEVMNRNTETGM